LQRIYTGTHKRQPSSCTRRLEEQSSIVYNNGVNQAYVYVTNRYAYKAALHEPQNYNETNNKLSYRLENRASASCFRLIIML